MWNKVQTHGNPSWIAQLQNQFTEALPAYFDCTEIQAADLRITQQWLRTMLWQLCVSQGLVSSMATDNTLTFKYPIEISRDLLSMTHQFSQHAMEVHGVGLVSLSKPLHFRVLQLKSSSFLVLFLVQLSDLTSLSRFACVTQGLSSKSATVLCTCRSTHFPSSIPVLLFRYANTIAD